MISKAFTVQNTFFTFHKKNPNIAIDIKFNIFAQTYYYAARPYLLIRRNPDQFSSELFSFGKPGLETGSVLRIRIWRGLGNGLFSR